jgi:hypothetical protein
MVTGVVMLGAMCSGAVRGAAAAPYPGARFVLEECDSALPGGGVPASEHGYNAVFAPYENCAAPGGSIGLVDSSAEQETFGALWISIPATPKGFVESETVTAVESGLEADGLGYSHVNENGFPGPVAEATKVFPAYSSPVAEILGDTGATSAEVLMSCGEAGRVCDPGPSEGVHYIAATEVDPHPPTVGPLTGTALSGTILRGHQTLDAEAEDVGGGLTNLSVLANGLSAATAVTGTCETAQVSNRSAYGTVAYSATPCPPKLKGEWTLDTTAYPFHDGENSMQVCASDFATLGNPNTTCSQAVSVDVDNSCTESPVVGGSEISADFAKTDSEDVTVGFGKTAEVTGELHDGAGDPISGATICVKSQTLGTGAASAPVAAVSTDAEGRFSYAVPGGPDRELMLGYRHDSFQVARDVRYFAHAAPSLDADPPKLRNGSRVKLWGSAPKPAAAGRVVILQANVVGSKRWITFRRATTDEQGDFRSGYQFHSTTRRTDYRFRAVVPRQDHYPYVEGHSKPVSVLVRPRRHRHRHQGER